MFEAFRKEVECSEKNNSKADSRLHFFNGQCEVHGADCHHEFEPEQLFDFQDVIVAVTCCILRKIKCYPKTSIEVPGASDPKGFKSVLQTYGWAHRFLRRLANQFGTQAVAVKLQKINWFVTTCFSGVGCAETVHYLLLKSVLIKNILHNELQKECHDFVQVSH